MKEEIADSLSHNFENLKKAYEFFIGESGLGVLDFNAFKTAINYLFPRRFIESDIVDMWNILAEGSKTVEFAQFQRVFAKKGQIYNEQYIDISKIPPGASSM